MQFLKICLVQKMLLEQLSSVSLLKHNKVSQKGGQVIPQAAELMKPDFLRICMLRHPTPLPAISQFPFQDPMRSASQ